MKRWLTCCCCILTLLALCAVAQADVLWEPDNNFYVKNADQCDYIGRQYYTNGDEGFITLWDAPAVPGRSTSSGMATPSGSTTSLRIGPAP